MVKRISFANPNTTTPREFPLDSLPPIIRDAVIEISAEGNTHPALAVSAILGVVSLICQDKIDVISDEIKGRIPCSLYLMAILRPVQGKSTVKRMVLKPLKEFDEEQMNKSSKKKDEYIDLHDCWKAERSGKLSAIRRASKNNESTEALKDDLQRHSESEPQPVKTPKLLFSDVNNPGVLKSMMYGWSSIGIMESEGEIVTQSAMEGFGNLNKLWDADPVSRVRARGEMIYINDGRLTMSIMIQPDVLESFVKGKGKMAKGSGFLSRVLVSWPPEMEWKYESKTAIVGSLKAIEKFYARVRELLNETTERANNLESNRKLLRFSDEAAARREQFKKRIIEESQNNGKLSQVWEAAARMPEIMCRMSALLHYFDGADDDIDFRYADGAAKICSWYLNEHWRLFDPVANGSIELTDSELLEKDILEKIIEKRKSDRISERLLYPLVHNRIRNPAKFKRALQSLSYEGKITLKSISEGAYATKMIIFNPQYFPIESQNSNGQAAQFSSRTDRVVSSSSITFLNYLDVASEQQAARRMAAELAEKLDREERMRPPEVY